MHLYFHTNTEMALYYIKALLRDGDEHPMSEIYDYVRTEAVTAVCEEACIRWETRRKP